MSITLFAQIWSKSADTGVRFLAVGVFITFWPFGIRLSSWPNLGRTDIAVLENIQHEVRALARAVTCAGAARRRCRQPAGGSDDAAENRDTEMTAVVVPAVEEAAEENMTAQEAREEEEEDAYFLVSLFDALLDTHGYPRYELSTN